MLGSRDLIKKREGINKICLQNSLHDIILHKSQNDLGNLITEMFNYRNKIFKPNNILDQISDEIDSKIRGPIDHVVLKGC